MDEDAEIHTLFFESNLDLGVLCTFHHALETKKIVEVMIAFSI